MKAAADELISHRPLRLEQRASRVVFSLLVLVTLVQLGANLGNSAWRPVNPQLLIFIWAMFAAWYGWQRWRVNGFRDRMWTDCLCTLCGSALKDVPVDEAGYGICPECCSVFNITSYLPPPSAVSALRAARQRVDRDWPRRPPSPKEPPPLPDAGLCLYASRGHFNRVIRSAAWRTITREPTAVDVTVGLGLCTAPVVAIVAGSLLSTSLYTVVAIVIGGLAVTAIVYLVNRFGNARQRIVRGHLCLRCGYELRQLPLADDGVGICPECGRPYHVAEYQQPAWDVDNPDWSEWRSIIIQHAAKRRPDSKESAE